MTSSYYEFFAGGGMARAGLGPGWTCLFANDFDPKKGASYAANWGDQHLAVGDVAGLSTKDIPGRGDLAWASFPCQDLSLAGVGAGLKGNRSGTFWPFWNLMKGLRTENRAPRVIVLENVYGALTSHGGKDFDAICSALAGENYRFGAMLIDAALFVPQSRPRLFVIAVDESLRAPTTVVADEPDERWHPQTLSSAYEKLLRQSKDAWIWWRLPSPPARNTTFAEVIEDDPDGVYWHSEAETKRLLSLMSPLNLSKVEDAKRTCRRMVGGVYRRTRVDAAGKKIQRAEVRFDKVAGGLRTPAGGSSRQFIIVVEGDKVRSRLLSPREAARLMGLPDDYVLPNKYNEAYHLAGDGVVVPVVRFLAANILEPILKPSPAERDAA